MLKFGWTARAAIVVLGTAFVIRGTETGNRLLQRVSLHQASHDILYNQESPFQAESITAPEPQQLDVPVVAEAKSVGLERVFTHRIGRGDTLSSFWSDIGGSREIAERFFEAFSGPLNSNNLLRAGDSVSVMKREGEIVEIRRKLSNEAVFVVTGSNEAGYRSRIEKLQITSRDRQVTGAISSSLVNSAESLGLPYALVDDFVDLFSSRVEFRRDLQPGDTFSILFEERSTTDGQELDPGAIKAASIKVGGQVLAVVRDVDAKGTVRYFDEKGRMPTKAFLRYPVKYTRISSVFSTSRFHPVLHIHRPHNGVDFSAPIGTPVRTIGDGVVLFAGYSSSMGNVVKIAHGNRYTTEYMHLSKIDPTIRKGSRIERGAVIGAVGKTGLASGPHLHFGLFDSGKYIDPLKSKISEGVDEIRAPRAVLAMISDIKKLHETISVASNATSRKKA